MTKQQALNTLMEHVNSQLNIELKKYPLNDRKKLLFNTLQTLMHILSCDDSNVIEIDLK